MSETNVILRIITSDKCADILTFLYDSSVEQLSFFYVTLTLHLDDVIYLLFVYFLACSSFNSLNAELNPICQLLALLGAHHILHVSKIRVNGCVCVCVCSSVFNEHMRIFN